MTQLQLAPVPAPLPAEPDLAQGGEQTRRLRDDAKLITTKTVERFYDPVKGMFLADRNIKGECPKCGAKDQYGDNCEVCGAELGDRQKRK